MRGTVRRDSGQLWICVLSQARQSIPQRADTQKGKHISLVGVAGHDYTELC